ncbi:hypothetical protein BN949_05512 [Agrobacterium tumefaciens]|nr:hypothetical protein BN949_05512 [Agrobacterium tumefaciens]
MPPRSVGNATLDMDASRERRIHQNDARSDGTLEVIVDMRGVVLRYWNAGEELLQQRVASSRIFVERKARAGEFRKNRHKAGSSRRFKNGVSRRDAGGARCDVGQRDRCRELLQGLALLGSTRVGRRQPRHLRQHGER